MPDHTHQDAPVVLPGVRALSIRQPWANLILAPGGKTTENRSWSTSWRGLIVIHAGQRFDDHARALAAALGLEAGRDQPTGYLGVVELTGCHLDRDCCRPWGEPGAFHFELRNPQAFGEPIPGPGRLRLYRALPPAVAAAAIATGRAAVVPRSA